MVDLLVVNKHMENLFVVSAGVVGVVVSSLTLHRGDLDSFPGFGIQAVRIHA